MRIKAVLSVLSLILCFTFMFTACSGSGSASADNLLKFIPVDVAGAGECNISKIAGTDIFKKMMDKSNDKDKGIDKFIKKTGIDPTKDLHKVAFAWNSDMGKKNQGYLVAALTYDKAKFDKALKEKECKFSKKDYKGVEVYSFEEKNEKFNVAFLSKSIIAVGMGLEVNKVVDCFKGDAKNILDNKKMVKYMDGKLVSIARFVSIIPEEVKKKSKGNPMFKLDMSKAELLYGNFDYESKIWKGNVTLISHNPDANKQLVLMINGFKGMAAAGMKVPELADKVNFTSTDDEIKMDFSISDELIEKIGNRMNEKAKRGTPPPPPPPADDKKADDKAA